jgi:hypothetical protein
LLLPHWGADPGQFVGKRELPKFGQFVGHEQLTQYRTANGDHNERSPISIPTSVVNLAAISQDTANLAHRIRQLIHPDSAAIAVVAAAFDVALREAASRLDG